MSSILGVTVGESAVRVVRPVDRTSPSAGFQFQVVETGKDEPARLAAGTLGVLFQTGVAGDPIERVGLVYRDQSQADRLRAAMAAEGIDRYVLVSEPEAAVTYLQATGELGSNTAVFYDLGDAGLTVTVVDLVTREVLAERTDSIGGRVFDNVIRDHQLDSNGVWRPDDPATDDELSAQCREAKEKLSESHTVAVPGAAGLVLMSRETFDPLISQCVESSAQFVHQVISRAGRNPEAVVLLGGGAHIPLVQEVLRSWLGLPLVVPHEPELVLAKGGAILAAKPPSSQPVSTLTRIVPGRPSSTTADTEQIPVVTATRSPGATAGTDSGDGQKPWWSSLASRGPTVSGKQISGAGLAGTALAVVAVIGVALSTGLTGASADGTSPTQSYVPSTSSAPRPSPAPAVAPTQVTTTTETPEPEPTTYSPRPVPPAPEPSPPPPPTIPGLGVPVPTLPPLPTIELPQLPPIRLP
ncbi:Hsp70 family protein [Rhodococcus sp. NPDC047139]|uniref:Hsp70 family protein n=1 Tax=Rhodococcus sp. NPDC047139 TaxID=3155141 RepID=UPI0033E10B30